MKKVHLLIVSLLLLVGCQAEPVSKYDATEKAIIRSQIADEVSEQYFEELYGHPMKAPMPTYPENIWDREAIMKQHEKDMQQTDHFIDYVKKTTDPRTKEYQELMRRTYEAYEREGVN